MKLVSILIFILFLCNTLFSQISIPNDSNNYKYDSLVKTAPLGYTNFFTQEIFAFNLGIEFRLTESIAIYVEGSLPSKSLKYIRPEIRLYHNNKNTSRKYMSIEYSYIEQHFQYGDSIGNDNKYYKKYDMSKYLNTFKVKYGWQKEIGRNFSLDTYIGLGIRHRNSIIKGLTDEEIENRDIGSSERYSFLDNGTYYLPNLALGIRIGYAIL